MKILFIYLSDFTGNSSRDRLKALISQWLKEGHDITLLTTKTTRNYFLKIYKFNEIRFLCNDHINEIQSPTTLKIVATYFERLIYGFYIAINSRYDAVYSITGLITETIPGYIFKFQNKKCRWIVLIDNLVPNPKNRVRGKSILVKSLAYLGFLISIGVLKKADQIFTVNSIVKNYLTSKRIISEEKILLTTNGIDLIEIDSVNSKNLIYDALYMGRLDEGKGLEDLIKIWSIVNQSRNVKSILAIAGSGAVDFEEKLRKLVLQEGLQEEIVFLGFKIGREKIETYKSSKIFVFPSKDESYPIVFLEALACGLPIVSYDLPAYKNVFPDNVYKSTKIGDHKGFSELIINEFSKSDDSLKKARLKFVENLDWSKVTSREYSSLK